MGLFGGSKARGRANEAYDATVDGIKKNKDLFNTDYTDSLAFENQKQNRAMNPDMEAYLSALRTFGENKEVVNNNQLQGDYSNAMQEGIGDQQEVGQLHSINNTTGGFKNQGSAQSAFQKMGQNVGDLYNKSTANRDAVLAKAGDWRQRFSDSQREFGNQQAMRNAELMSQNAERQSQLDQMQAESRMALQALHDQIREQSRAKYQMFAKQVSDSAKQAITGV